MTVADLHDKHPEFFSRWQTFFGFGGPRIHMFANAFKGGSKGLNLYEDEILGCGLRAVGDTVDVVIKYGCSGSSGPGGRDGPFFHKKVVHNIKPEDASAAIDFVLTTLSQGSSRHPFGYSNTWVSTGVHKDYFVCYLLGMETPLEVEQRKAATAAPTAAPTPS